MRVTSTRQRTVKHGVRALLAAGLVVTLAACGGTSSSAASDGGTGELTVGLIGPLTGSGAAWGVGMKGAVELAIKEVNDAGGVEVDGTKFIVKLKAYDDQYLAANGLSALNRLVEFDKVNMIIGSIGGVVNQALVPVVTEKKIIHLSDGLGNYLGKQYPYTFRVHPDISVWGPADAEWIAKNTAGGVKTVALMTTDDESGSANAAPVIKGFEAAGAKVTVEKYRRGQTDFSSVLTRLIKANPDVIEAEGTPGDAPLIVKQARELGYKGQITHVGGPVAQAVLSVAGAEYSEGFTYFQPFDTTTSGYKEFFQKFQDAYKTDMNDFAPYFYDSALLLFKSLTAAGTVTDTDKIAEALRTTSLDSPLRGQISFGGEEHWGCKCEIESSSFIGRLVGGKPTIVSEVK
jgi:branched-chain amino acid transport system substrate-binding protein